MISNSKRYNSFSKSHFSFQFGYYHLFYVFFCCCCFQIGGYYTIEQTKSRLRIIALNTNFMRHDVKYAQSHSAPIRQRPGDTNEHNNYRYHHNNHYRSNGINGYSASNIDEHGGMVSALSGGENHESQKQWDWLEDVLAKSSRNKETVCNSLHISLSISFHFHKIHNYFV